MSYLSHIALGGIAAVLLSASACRPDQPATERPSTAQSPAASPTLADTALAYPSDTLHLPSGVVRLRPVSAAEFAKLPSAELPDVANDSAAERQPLAAAQGRARREGLTLVLKPAQGPLVRLASTPPAEFTLQNGEGVRYQYWGSLPAAHQWVVRAWYWESDGTVLIDQRTGRRVEVLGNPVASPDGRFVLLTSPSLGGGDQPNTLSLVKIEDDGPHLLWQREPTAWEPEAARWDTPNLAILRLRHASADGSLADDAPVTYVQLPLPR
ncbi:hypothetical protein FNT36_14240 [Hymenobacter setariae]|uniref:Lipoprotein n=1 Tax=Hymenobacter setariae TaxID=2594794 RepID=A0A558BVR7_9BACT|nr:hypothetical protein [Hymenobacter setariae]TVT40625.1 hypothetical protein FNT36_14240 [Hymenobacter setariae]